MIKKEKGTIMVDGVLERGHMIYNIFCELKEPCFSMSYVQTQYTTII